MADEVTGFPWPGWCRESVAPGQDVDAFWSGGRPIVAVDDRGTGRRRAWLAEGGMPVPQEAVMLEGDTSMRYAYPGGRCRACGLPAGRDGTDPCLGRLDGVSGACCGHGVDEPYVTLEGMVSQDQQLSGDEARAWLAGLGVTLPPPLPEGSGTRGWWSGMLRPDDAAMLTLDGAFAEVLAGFPGGADAFVRRAVGPCPDGEWDLARVGALAAGDPAAYRAVVVAFLAEAGLRYARLRVELPFPGFGGVEDDLLRQAGYGTRPTSA